MHNDPNRPHTQLWEIPQPQQVPAAYRADTYTTPISARGRVSARLVGTGVLTGLGGLGFALFLVVLHVGSVMNGERPAFPVVIFSISLGIGIVGLVPLLTFFLFRRSGAAKTE